jgi:hypothetical protein
MSEKSSCASVYKTMLSGAQRYAVRVEGLGSTRSRHSARHPRPSTSHKIRTY